MAGSTFPTLTLIEVRNEVRILQGQSREDHLNSTTTSFEQTALPAWQTLNT